MKNLTSHRILIYNYEKEDFPQTRSLYPHPSGPARVEANTYGKEIHKGFKTVEKDYPFVVKNFSREGKEDVIVDALVAETLRESRYPMEGIFTVDTGPEGVVRDDEGRIFAVKRLIRHISCGDLR